MTKRKAIEAAIAKGWDAGIASASVRAGCIISAECAYESGRIAGLREAAAMLPSYCCFEQEKIYNRANKLAKKARAKK